MTPQELCNDLIGYCKVNANPELVKKYSRYFKEGVYDAWGLSQSLMDAKKTDLKKSGEITIDMVFETAPLLMKSGKYEETSFALALLGSLVEKSDHSTFDRLEAWFSIGIANWAHADYLGMFLLPEYLKKGIITKEDFSGWIVSSFKFQRRCVPVAFIKLLKTGVSFQELFSFLEPLMRDPQREVHQGMGWFLREAWKIKPEETEAYLLKWRDTAPRLIFQYACEKMKPEEKLRFRKAK
ncbi:MAG: DNA alkylation repair protein [Bacteroidota bacterium]